MGRRAVLGVNVRQDQPARYDREGVRLYGVDDDTPAGKAGFQEGDILTTVDGRSLLDALPERREEERLAQDGSLPVQRLLRILRKHEAGDSLTIEYLRGGARRTAAVVMERPRGLPRLGVESGAFGFGPGDPLPPIGLALGPEGAMIAGMRNACPSRGGPGDRGVAWLGRSCVAGVELLSMQPELAEYFGADGGVLVTDANPDNPLGLESGDVLLAVDGRAITGVDRALRVLRSYEGEEEVALRVLRKRQTMELKGRMSG